MPGSASGQPEVDPSVLPALVLDLADFKPPDLARRANVSAAARLQIHSLDLQEPDPAGAAGRLDRHRPHQLLAGRKLRLIDPPRLHGMIGFDQTVEFFLQPDLVRGLRQIEVEPALAIADLAAGHFSVDQRAEQMQAGMDAHVSMTALPVELQPDFGSRLGQAASLGQDVDHLIRPFALLRIDDLQCRSIRQQQATRITGLAAALRVEDRAIQTQTARCGGHYPRTGGGKIGIFPEQQLHERKLSSTAAATKGTSFRGLREPRAAPKASPEPAAPLSAETRD